MDLAGRVDQGLGGHIPGMVGRHELTDTQWTKIEPLLPVNGKPGGQWADHRKVINGVLYRARTGLPWPDLPERYGPRQTV
jgi:transposase